MAGRMTMDELAGVPAAGEVADAPKVPGGARGFLSRWPANKPTAIPISGRHRAMVHTWQLAMETATPEGQKPPTVRESAETLIELGWACAHLPFERRMEIIQEAKHAADAAGTKP